MSTGTHMPAKANLASKETSKSTEIQQPHLTETPISYHLSSTLFSLGKIAIQPKLKIGQSSSILEQEAEEIAEKIVDTSTVNLAHPEDDAANNNFHITKWQNHKISTKGLDYGGYEASENAERMISNLGGGFPLDPETRTFMESRFGFGFGHVKIHSDLEAEASARAVNAFAYTFKNNIVFDYGRYLPKTHEGKKLLAHELTHVVQQGTTPDTVIQRSGSAAASDPPLATLSVTMSGMRFTPQGNPTFSGGETRYEAMAIVLRRLVGPQYQTGLEREVINILDQHDYEGTGSLRRGNVFPAGTAVEDITFDIVVANELISILEKRKLAMNLSKSQREILALGLASSSLYDEIKDKMPEWYTEFIFAREMAQRASLIGAFRDVSHEPMENPVRKQAVQNILDSIMGPAKTLELIRQDFRIAHEQPTKYDNHMATQEKNDAVLGYCIIWNIEIAKARQLTQPPVPKVQENSATLFLAYLHTQPQLAEKAAAAEGHDARVTLLARFIRFMGRVAKGATGDEPLLMRPGKATDEAWDATLSSYPPLQPPLFEAALETDHRFSMSLNFADWTDAFAMYAYLWERIRIPDTPAGSGGPPDSATMAGERPSLGEVYDVRMRRARRYNAADIQRIRDQTGVPFGTSAHDLVGVNNTLRIAGTVIRLGLERITMPRHEKQVIFPSPGLYVIRARAVPILEGDEEVTRPPSVAYQPVVARDPMEMAVRQVQETAYTQFQARLRIGEIKALLESPFPPENREELLLEMKYLQSIIGGPAELLAARKSELEEHIKRIEERIRIQSQIRDLEAGSAPDSEALSRLRQRLAELGGSRGDREDRRLLSSLKDQLETVNETIATRKERLKGETGTLEIMHATFVSDLGHSISLSLEVVDKGSVNGQREVFISDLTTLQSGVGRGRSSSDPSSSQAKVESVTAAMLDLLENSSDYGRGQVAFKVEGMVYSRRVEAGTGRLLSEAVENATMVVSIAAIAAAPFTGGASLYILLPLGVVGAIPSAYRMYTRYEASTLRWDLQTTMDIVNIAGGMLGLAHAATPLRMVRMGQTLMVMGIGSDGAGILLMGAGIVQQLDSLQGLPEGERAARMLEIIGNAMIQIGIQSGGMVAHATYKQRGDRPPTGLGEDAPGFRLPREEPAATVPPVEAGTSSGGRTMGGLGSGSTPPLAAQRQPSRFPPSSPERLLETLSKGIERSLPPSKPGAEVANSPPSGTYRRGIYSSDAAYLAYNDALSVSAGREAAVYHNPQSGEFCVRMGDENGVNSPPGEFGWNAIVHYHPNPTHALTYRLPAPADFQGLLLRFMAEGQMVREFVEFDIPGVGRGRTEYGIDPSNAEPFYVRINMADGTQRTIRFAHDGAYQTYWGSRTVHVEPGSPQYKAMIEDIARYVRSREGIIDTSLGSGTGKSMAGARLSKQVGPLQTADGRLTAEGIAFIRRKYRTVTDNNRRFELARLTDDQIGEMFPRQWRWLEAIVVAEARADWVGRSTATEFVLANPNQTFHDIFGRLQRGVTEGNTGHTLNNSVLGQNVRCFVESLVNSGNPVLKPAYDLCENYTHPDPQIQSAFRKRWEEFKNSQKSGDMSGFFMGMVGDKKPDVVEVMLGQGEIHIYDASFAYGDPIHNFKSAFYRAVMESLINVNTVTATDYRSPLRQTPMGP
jgi:hypothetical protein